MPILTETSEFIDVSLKEPTIWVSSAVDAAITLFGLAVLAQEGEEDARRALLSCISKDNDSSYNDGARVAEVDLQQFSTKRN